MDLTRGRARRHDVPAPGSARTPRRLARWYQPAPVGVSHSTGLARYGRLAASAIAYLYVVPYLPRHHSANELPRAHLVKAIADDHTFASDRSVPRWGPTADASPARGQ